MWCFPGKRRKDDFSERDFLLPLTIAARDLRIDSIFEELRFQTKEKLCVFPFGSAVGIFLVFEPQSDKKLDQ